MDRSMEKAIEQLILLGFVISTHTSTTSDCSFTDKILSVKPSIAPENKTLSV